jgi:WD40 repeat protein
MVSFVADETGSLCFALSPDGRSIVSSGYDQKVKLWDAATGSLVRPLSGQLNNATTAVFSPDGRRIAMVGSDKLISVWDFDSGQNLVTIRTSSSAWGIGFSPDGHILATNHQNGELKLWDGSPKAADGR